jgi:hypothetical protein
MTVCQEKIGIDEERIEKRGCLKGFEKFDG